MGYFCKMAYNIGEDLFAYDNGRVVAMAEYVANTMSSNRSLQVRYRVAITNGSAIHA